MSVVKDALSRPAFTVDGLDHTVADVAGAALYLGEWTGVQARAAAGTAWVEAEGAGAAPAAGVTAAAELFRRDRRLLAAEEMEGWLARRGLSAGEWMRWVRMDVARRTAPAPPGDAVPTASTLYAEAICSGALARAARWFAELLVAGTPAQAVGNGRAGSHDPAHLEALGVERGTTTGVLDAIHARSSALQELADRSADAKAVDARVRARQTDWLGIDFRVLALAGESAAREALLCVRDDGMTLEEVADVAGVEVLREHALLADLGPALQPHLLSASRGELIGPVARGGGAAILVVDAKVDPSADDPDVAQRARREILTGILEREITTRVQWHDRL